MNPASPPVKVRAELVAFSKERRVASVLIDTGVIVAAFNERDLRHSRGKQLMDDILAGEYGMPYSSDFVLDEVVTLTLARTRSHQLASLVGRFLLPLEGPPCITLLHVDENVVRRAWKSFLRHDEAVLSFADWTIVEQTKLCGIELVASFDSGLDGWVERLE